jgi:hypothetical protein
MYSGITNGTGHIALTVLASLGLPLQWLRRKGSGSITQGSGSSGTMWVHDFEDKRRDVPIIVFCMSRSPAPVLMYSVKVTILHHGPGYCKE